MKNSRCLHVSSLAVLGDPGFVLNIVHVFGAIIAIGAVIVTDAINMVLHFRGDFAQWDARLAPLLSILVWIGFLLLAVSGTFLFLQQPTLIHDTVFQLKMFFVAVVFLNGVFLNAWITPTFQELADDWDDSERTDHFERIAGAAAMISVFGWIIVFVLGYVLGNT